MAKKKVLIITYYWPPSGGAGVQRWLKFTKYLREFDWEPIIYTVSNPNYPNLDNSLIAEIPAGIKILKKEIWEPYNLYRIFTNRKKEHSITTSFTSEKKTNKTAENLSNWVRSNFFIPDARKFWIKPSIKYLKKQIEENSIEVVVTTGPPHSLHLIGLGLKKRSLNLSWVADFRDPWTNIDYFRELKLTKWGKNYHHKLEKEVLKSADRIIVVGNQMRIEFQDIGAENVEVISNGFDESDIEGYDEVVVDEKFSLSHLGILMRNRNPKILWEALNQLVSENHDLEKDLEIKLVGNVDFEVMDSIKSNGLEKYIKKFEYMPHDEIIRFQKSSQVLLLLINNSGNAKGMLTGKFFEYLASGRPILAVGPVDGDAADILNKTNAGVISGFDDLDSLKENILDFYKLFKKNKLKSQASDISSYSRKELTRQLSKLLNQVKNQ